MRFIRGLFSGLGLSLLTILLVVFSLCAVAYSTAGNPSFIKNAVKSSGLYHNFVESTLEFVGTETLAEDEEMPKAVGEGESTPAEPKDPDDNISDERAQILTDLTPTFESVLTPEKLESTVETVFDGIADWFTGKTDEIEFTVDTAEIRTDLGIALADYMEQRLADLPPFPSSGSMSDYDPLTSEYAPRQPYSREQLEQTGADLAAEMPLLDKDVQTGDDLPDSFTDSDGVDTARVAYRWGRLGVILFAVLVVLGATLMLLFSHDRPRVLRRLGHVSIVPGVLLLAAGAVVALFVANLEVLAEDGASAARETFDQAITLPLWDSLFTRLGLVVIAFGAAWVLIAIACYILGHTLKRGQPETMSPAPSAVGSTPAAAITPTDTAKSQAPEPAPPTRDS